LRDRDGQVVGAVTVLRDQTERKRLEREREEALAVAQVRTAELEAVFGAMTDGVVVYDRTGRGTYANPVLRAMAAGHVPPDYGHLPLSERAALTPLRTPAGDVVPEDQLPHARLLRGEVLAGASSPELLFDAQDGRTYTVQYAGSPLRDETGAITGAVMVLRNVTEERRLQHELAEQAAQLDRIVEGIRDGVVAYNVEGQVVRSNAAARRLLGLDAAPPTYAHLAASERARLYEAYDDQGHRLAPEDWPLLAVLRGQTETGADGREMRLRTLDGRAVEVHSAVAPLRDAEGRLVGAVTILHDQTQRKRGEARLRHLQEVTARFAAAQTLAEVRQVLLGDVMAAVGARGAALRLVTDHEVRLDEVALDSPVDDAVLRRVAAVPLEAAHPAAEAACSGEPIFIHDAAELLQRYPSLHDLIREAAPEAVAHLPLRRGEEVFGVLSLHFNAAHTWDAPERAFVQALADRAAVAYERARLFEAEHEARRQLEAVLQVLPAGVVIADAQGKFLQVNPAFHDAWGEHALPQRLEEYHLFQGWHPDGTPMQREDWPMARALAREETVRACEIEIQAADGVRKTILSNAAPLRDIASHLTGGVVAFLDITQRKQLEREREEALARAQARTDELEAVFGAMTDGVVVYDPTGNITYLNTAIRTLFSLDARPDFAHLSLAERARLTRARTPMGQVLPVDQLPQSRVLRGEVLAPGGDVATTDIVEEALDGRVLTLQVAGSPLHDAGGAITGAVLVFRDVTAERRLQHATLVLAVQLQATLDAMSDAVFLYGTDGQVLRLNAAAQALVDAEPDFLSVEGRTWWERVRPHQPRRPDGRPFSRKEWPLARVLRGERLSGIDVQEVVLTDAQGREQVRTYAGGPARDAVGKLMGYVFVVRDVTERRRLERERQEAETRELAAQEVAQQLDQFLAMASHDIRTPVTSLSGNLELARLFVTRLAGTVEGLDTLEGRTARQLATVLERADESSTRLARLVALLFDMTSARLGTLTVAQAPCDLVALAREQVAALQDTVPERTIEVDLPSDAVVVQADADRLGQVLTNYLTNALKYSAADQPVAVRLEVREERVIVSVQDHGPGLLEEEQQRVWDLYYRAPGVAAQSSIGVASGSLGMGLFVCKRLVEAHPGGQVGVASVDGEGCTFWFSLPVAVVSSATE
jgi:PAS domain S-box-containing protein